MSPAQNTTVTIPISSSIPPHLSSRSPRSSLDSSPRTPTSPFLHNLSNRFRKSSNASNLSNKSDPPSQSADPTEKIETAQSAKRYVLSVIRNDWDWPPPQPPTVPGGENITVEERRQESVIAQREPVGWRTRFEGASDLDLDLTPLSPSGRRRAKRGSDPYRFESPDAIANVIQEQRHKIRCANAEETAWNEGLRTWMERRDAWTAAESKKPKKRSFSEAEGHQRTFSSLRAHHKSSRSSEDSKTHKSISSTANGTNSENEQNPSIAVDSPNSSEADEESSYSGPYLPIYPPLFPTSHTLRARIKPAAYPTIYSKVVVQSLTPNVPIPLTHMVGALVDGWKAEGNWPPQTLAEQQTHALLKRAKGAKKADSAFQKWRKERDVERKQLQDDFFQSGFAEELAADEEQKKGFRRSISGAVKKVLGIHAEVDEDGGLAKLGLSFGHASDQDDRLMKESQQIAEDNVILNKGLLEGEKV